MRKKNVFRYGSILSLGVLSAIGYKVSVSYSPQVELELHGTDHYNQTGPTETVIPNAALSKDSIINSKALIDPPPRTGDSPPPIPNEYLTENSAIANDSAASMMISLRDLMSKDRASLIQIVASSNDAELVQKAVWVLGNRMSLGDSEFNTLLQRFENTDPSKEKLRKTILWALSLRPELLPADRISDIAINDHSDTVRRTALRTLATNSGDEINAVLKTAAISDNDSQNRREALYLSTINKTNIFDIDQSEQAFAMENDKLVRESWIAYIGNKFGDAGQDMLFRIARASGEDFEIRIKSAQMLVVINADNLNLIQNDPLLPARIKTQVVAD